MVTRRRTLAGWVLVTTALLIGCGWMINEPIMDAAGSVGVKSTATTLSYPIVDTGQTLGSNRATPTTATARSRTTSPS